MPVGWAVSRWWGYDTGYSGSSCRSSGMRADAGTSLDPKGPKKNGASASCGSAFSPGKTRMIKNTDVKSRRIDGQRIRHWLAHFAATLAAHVIG